MCLGFSGGQGQKARKEIKNVELKALSWASQHMLPIFSKLPCVHFLSQKWCLSDAHTDPRIRRSTFLRDIVNTALEEYTFLFSKQKSGI